MSSEDDADEEQKLATDSGRGLQFTHRGRTCVLTNDKELQEWLAERKRKFPTRERREAASKEAEERKQKWEAEKRKRNEERQARQAADKARRDELSATRGKSNARKKRSKGGRSNAEPAEEGSKDPSIKSAQSQSPSLKDAKSASGHSRPDELHVSSKSVESGAAANAALDAVTKAKQRAEKFRKKALKEEAKAREAEAEALAIQRDYDVHEQASTSTKNQHPPNSSKLESQSHCKEEIDSESSGLRTAADTALLTPTSPSDLRLNPVKDEPADPDDEDRVSISSSSTDPSTVASDSDSTSSSGSSAIFESEPDSDSDCSTASGPESHPLHPVDPIRVPPPPRKGPSTTSTSKKANVPICFQFRNTGTCARGEGCQFSHNLEQPANQGKGRAQRKRKQKEAIEPADKNQHQAKERKSLYQVLVKKEKDDERRKMLDAICWLGERGMLNEHDKHDEHGEQSVDGKLLNGDMKGEEEGRKLTKAAIVEEEAKVANARRFAEDEGEAHRSRVKTEGGPLAMDMMVAAAAAAPL